MIVSLTGFSPSVIRCSKRFSYHHDLSLSVLSASRTARAPLHPRYNGCSLYCIGRFRLIRVRSSLLTESLDYFFFLGVLRYFTSPRSLTPAYEFSGKFSGITLRGLPHSEIAGLQVVSTYPALIAGYHVLRRLLVPRHPPYALSSLTKNLSLVRTHRCRPFPRRNGRKDASTYLERTFLGFSSPCSTPLFAQRLDGAKANEHGQLLAVY